MFFGGIGSRRLWFLTIGKELVNGTSDSCCSAKWKNIPKPSEHQEGGFGSQHLSQGHLLSCSDQSKRRQADLESRRDLLEQKARTCDSYLQI